MVMKEYKTIACGLMLGGKEVEAATYEDIFPSDHQQLLKNVEVYLTITVLGLQGGN